MIFRFTTAFFLVTTVIFFTLWISDAGDYNPELGGSLAEWIGGLATAAALLFGAEQIRQERLVQERREQLRLKQIFSRFLASGAEFASALENNGQADSESDLEKVRVQNAERDYNAAASDLRFVGDKDLLAASNELSKWLFRLRDTVNMVGYDRERADQQWARHRDATKSEMLRMLGENSVHDEGWSIFDEGSANEPEIPGSGRGTNSDTAPQMVAGEREEPKETSGNVAVAKDPHFDETTGNLS